jgi:hypothetical protein
MRVIKLPVWERTGYVPDNQVPLKSSNNLKKLIQYLRIANMDLRKGVVIYDYSETENYERGVDKRYTLAMRENMFFIPLKNNERRL